MERDRGAKRFGSKKRKMAEKSAASKEEVEESELPDKVEPQLSETIKLPPSFKEGEKGKFRNSSGN